MKLAQSNWLRWQAMQARRATVLAAVGVMIVPLLITCSLWAADKVLVPGIVGHWEGNAQSIVIWYQQTNLPVSLDIRVDGVVTGKIGDATLTNGRLRRNRGWLGRRLHIKTDYIITGRLNGPIVKAESITRSGVKMPLSFSKGNFVGSIHTTGCKFGGKQRGILTAGLTLVRTADPLRKPSAFDTTRKWLQQELASD